jgi:succinate dehydrogenase (ubiquinone) cytochrome b560 subunit
MSAAHRVTGVALGAGKFSLLCCLMIEFRSDLPLLQSAFYAGAISYLALPALGYNFDTASVVAAAAALPVAAKVGIKATVAFPFVFHCLNGVRHLVSIESRMKFASYFCFTNAWMKVWDTGRFLTLKGVYQTGYAVLGGSTLASLYLASL